MTRRANEQLSRRGEELSRVLVQCSASLKYAVMPFYPAGGSVALLRPEIDCHAVELQKHVVAAEARGRKASSSSAFSALHGLWEWERVRASADPTAPNSPVPHHLQPLTPGNVDNNR